MKTRRVVAPLVVIALVAMGATWGVTAGGAPVGKAWGAPPLNSISGDQLTSSTSPSPVAPEESLLAWGPSEADWDDALATASALELDRAAGQVLVASYSSTSTSGLRKLISEHHLGGVIFMGGAITDADSVRSLTQTAQEAGADRDWPVVVSVDHEGGPVARLSGILPGLPAFMASGSALDKSVVRDAHASTGVGMADLGFNVNFAPVADVTIGPADPVIRIRSAGSDAENVSRTVEAAMLGLIDGGIAPTVKHFPGHGSVTTDSHLALPTQSMSVAELEERDLIPFARAIDAGAPAVMMSHIALAEWGGGPTTLAPEAYRYLREDLGFTGVVITDALNMRAVSDLYGSGDAAVAALAAGADIVLMPADIGEAHRGIVAAVESGELSRERLDEAAARSILLMRWQAQLVPVDVTEDNAARSLVAASATVVASLCGRPLVGDAVSITGGLASDREALASALESRGVTVGAGGTSVALMGSGGGSLTADVVVALDAPWLLADANADTYVATYGRSSDAMQGLADVLVGSTQPQAVWPVTVRSMPYGPCPSPR